MYRRETGDPVITLITFYWSTYANFAYIYECAYKRQGQHEGDGTTEKGAAGAQGKADGSRERWKQGEDNMSTGDGDGRMGWEKGVREEVLPR
jgi:hypothetical protein